jgi:hypothetical protein
MPLARLPPRIAPCGECLLGHQLAEKGVGYPPVFVAPRGPDDPGRIESTLALG